MLPLRRERSQVGNDFADFVRVAVKFGMVSHDRANEIVRLALEHNVSPWQCALEHGDFDLTDVDVVKTLLNPQSSVAGYEILAPLGRGGMGVVYQARQLSLQRDVALKTILLSQLSNATAVKRFENEAKILASLAHPNIVTAHDFGRSDGRLFLAMEFLRGKDVQQLVEHFGPISEGLTWHIVRQAAAGLAQASQAGVIHRDIKPANLLLVRPPDGFMLPANVPLVKIADFGLSTLAAEQSDDASERLTSATSQVGSPLYMAPEQIESKEASAASDMFSLGATAWHMLVGEPPLKGLRLRELITRRLSQPAESVASRRDDLTAETDSLISDMMHVEPAQRISSYEALLQRIDRIVSELHFNDQVLPWLAASTGLQPALQPPSVSPLESMSELGETKAFEAPELGNSKKLRRRSLALGIAALTIAGTYGLYVLLNRTPDSTRTIERFGPRITLFDGRTLNGWLPQSGGWAPTVDSEGSRVLGGENGLITYDFARLLKATDSQFYAIEVAVDCGDAAMANVEFDFDMGRGLADAGNPSRHVIRLTPDRVVLGVISDGDSLTQQQVFVRTDNAATVFQIERQLDTWWLFRDGRRLAVLPHLHSSASARLVLSSVGGTAFFADIAFEPEDK